MINLVTLFAAMALVALQCSHPVSAQIETSKIDLDNNIQPNLVPTQRRRLQKYVRINMPPPSSVSHTPGTRLQLDCVAMGSPAPVIHWLRNGEPIVDYEDEANEIPTHHPSNIASLTSKLLVSAVRDGDLFTCVATAGMKEDSASTTVYLEGDEPPKMMTLEKLFSVPSKPVITSFYTEILQEMGTTLIMPCRVQSLTDHQVFWHDNQGDLVYSNPRIRVLPSGDLMISGLRWSDMGQWTCTAQNAYGKDSAATFVYPVKRKQ
ncbi:unnamed protein product, partial [Iphiclides podalirius]